MKRFLLGQRGAMFGQRLNLHKPVTSQKGAMFGQRLDLHKPVTSQKGAMFGLDARIALAIFGVLSVVGGYSATSMFKEAQITQLATELNNLKKAYQEFHLSTGEHSNRFMDLINNAYDIAGWQGPYTDLLSDKSRISEGIYTIHTGRQDVDGVPPVECTGGICAQWIKLTAVRDNTAKDLDERLDTEASPTKGVLRIAFQQGGTDDIYFLMMARHGD